MNTIHHSSEAVRYMQQVFPRRKRRLDRFSRFCNLHGLLGDRPTDRPRYSLGTNKRSAQWRSQILLLSMATSIHWSSRFK